MNVLIIEDDPTKLRDIEDALLSIDELQIVGSAASYQAGLKSLFNKIVDVVILDMTLPHFDGGGIGGAGRKIQFGGELILQEMKEEGLNQRVVIVSQHDYFADHVAEITLEQLGQRLKEKFGTMIVDTILYDSSEFAKDEVDGWRSKLKLAINICRTK